MDKSCPYPLLGCFSPFTEDAVGRKALCPGSHSFQSGFVSQECFAAGLSPGAHHVCQVPAPSRARKPHPAAGWASLDALPLLPAQLLLGALKL